MLDLHLNLKKFQVEGQSFREAKKILKEAELIEKAGAFSIVLECLSPQCSKTCYK